MRRGLLHEILTDWLDVGGRHPGAMFAVRGRGGVKPSLTLGVFQGRVAEEITPGDRNMDPISLDTTGSESYLDAQSYVARVGAELADLVDVGLYYEHRVGSPAVGEFEHYPTAGVDAVLDSVFDNGGLRVWFDAMLGKSWYEHAEKAVDDDDATFMAARLCTGLRFGGVEPDQLYVEPFAFFSVFEPDRDVVNDFVYEAALGVNVGYWDRARIAPAGRGGEQRPQLPSHQHGLFQWQRARSPRAPSARRGGVLMFVVFEGIDGSGKTTVSNLVAERLSGGGLKVKHLRADGSSCPR